MTKFKESHLEEAKRLRNLIKHAIVIPTQEESLFNTTDSSLRYRSVLNDKKKKLKYNISAF